MRIIDITFIKYRFDRDETSNSILRINISENTTDIGPPIGLPSTYFNNFPVTENTNPFVNLNKSFLNIDDLH